jgi:hypothetical protein
MPDIKKHLEIFWRDVLVDMPREHARYRLYTSDSKPRLLDPPSSRTRQVQVQVQFQFQFRFRFRSLLQ